MRGSPDVSSEYWDRIYRRGGRSGTGSLGRLAEFKAEVIKALIQELGVKSVVELGCGDGTQLGLIDYPAYVGMDTSPAAVEMCRERYRDDTSKQFQVLPRVGEVEIPRADMAISLDVVYHLLEDDSFDTYMRRLFGAAERWVLIYASNTGAVAPWPEVRNRRFTDWVDREASAWRLLRTVPNRYPYQPHAKGDTSISDFYLYGRQLVVVPMGLADRVHH